MNYVNSNKFYIFKKVETFQNNDCRYLNIYKHGGWYIN